MLIRLSGVTGFFEDLEPQITVLPDGGYVVVWQGQTPDQGWDVFVQHFDAFGKEVAPMQTLQGATGALDDTVPQVTALPDGGYVVTWQGATADNQGVDIFVQQFDAAGNQVSDFRMQGVGGNQNDVTPQITTLADGGYVITWSGSGTSGAGSEIFIRQFDADGNPVNAANTRLNTGLGNVPDNSPQITALPDGGYVVIWTGGTGSLNQGGDIMVRQFDAAGNQITNTMLRGESGNFVDTQSQIAVLADGGYVVAWQGQTTSQSNDVFLQRFDAAGNQLSRTTLQGQPGNFTDTAPKITALADGGYAVVWEGRDSNQTGPIRNDIYLRQFDAAGNVVVSERLQGVPGDPDSFNDQRAQIAALVDGGYVVVWQGDTDDGEGFDIFTRQYDADGTLVAENRLAAFGAVVDTRPDIIPLPGGGYLVVWEGGTLDGQRRDIFINRFNALGEPVCFTRGTLIETASGPVPVERLAAGDMLRTLDHGFRPVRLVCRTACDSIDLRLRPAIRPVRITAGALGNGLPQRDLLVSPQHRMLVSSRIAERMFGTTEVLIPAIRLTALPGVFIDESVTEVEYFHVLLDEHQVIFAEGAPSESLLTGPQALRAVGAAAREEIRALFPQIAEAEYAPIPARPVPLGRQQKKLVERHSRNRRPVL
ncbi:Hint domain-containing protein [Roseovarius azorensis]|uniref:Hint domain-containing protein n=1 Tax=Roseovarius azorensis TaxID=1287727 RepID=A0A1H7KHW0_9RHOB|nr:Hint domain-containing protein [Roseovarius azorensis]SEK86362.1 Hint domain-containing protein [Roseovarius azorensis]